MTNPSVAFIGTGNFGAPMAASLLRSHFKLTVTDTRPQAAEALLRAGALWAGSVSEAVAAADLVFTCLPSQAALEMVYLGTQGIASGATKPVCVVDLSTSGTLMAARMGAALKERGVGFVDAPVTGGLAAAREGRLTVIAAGDRSSIDLARPALGAIGERVYVVGSEPGQAQKVKLINNMLNYTALIATAEAVVLGTKAGVDPALLVEIINNGSGRNSATATKFPQAILPRTFNYGASHHIVEKDLGLYLELADGLDVPSPVAQLVYQLWRWWIREHGDEDFTTIVRMFEDWSGVKVASSESKEG